MDELVSIIVPVYNTGEYLAPCVESLIAQTYQNIEIILVNDGSTDGSGVVCDDFACRDERVKVIHQKNSGVSAARNAGLNAMRGAYLLFVDGDDTIAPNTIELALRGFQDGGADLVVFGVTKIWKQEERQEDLPMEVGLFSRKEMLFGILKDYASFGAGFPVNKVWRVDSFGSRADIPRFDRELFFFEDMEWVVRMLLRIRSARLLPEHCYHYYIRPTSATHRPGVQERREIGYHKSIRKILDALSTDPAVFAWFSQKYYPEIVNGVIHAVRQHWPELKQHLVMELLHRRREILTAQDISAKIKFRCRVLHTLQLLHLL